MFQTKLNVPGPLKSSIKCVREDTATVKIVLVPHHHLRFIFTEGNFAWILRKFQIRRDLRSISVVSELRASPFLSLEAVELPWVGRIEACGVEISLVVSC